MIEAAEVVGVASMQHTSFVFALRLHSSLSSQERIGQSMEQTGLADKVGESLNAHEFEVGQRQEGPDEQIAHHAVVKLPWIFVNRVKQQVMEARVGLEIGQPILKHVSGLR